MNYRQGNWIVVKCEVCNHESHHKTNHEAVVEERKHQHYDEVYL